MAKPEHGDRDPDLRPETEWSANAAMHQECCAKASTGLPVCRSWIAGMNGQDHRTNNIRHCLVTAAIPWYAWRYLTTPWADDVAAGITMTVMPPATAGAV
jgi:hypothetical protein